MLGRVFPQGSLLEARVMRRHLVTKNSFYARLADHGHEIVTDDDFAHGTPVDPAVGDGAGHALRHA